MNWPSHFPKTCPPDDSLEASGDVYRLVGGEPPKKEDFISHWVKSPHNRKVYAAKGKACEFCGLSVFRTMEDARRLSRRVRHLPKKIAKATLGPSMGRIKNTGNEDHCTWWVPTSVKNPAILFKNVA